MFYFIHPQLATGKVMSISSHVHSSHCWARDHPPKHHLMMDLLLCVSICQLVHRNWNASFAHPFLFKFIFDMQFVLFLIRKDHQSFQLLRRNRRHRIDIGYFCRNKKNNDAILGVQHFKRKESGCESLVLVGKIYGQILNFKINIDNR